MANPTSRGQQRDKPFRDALRMEAKLAEEGIETPAKPGSLRYIARQLLVRAGDETAATKEVFEKPGPLQATRKSETLARKTS